MDEKTIVTYVKQALTSGLFDLADYLVNEELRPESPFCLILRAKIDAARVKSGATERVLSSGRSRDYELAQKYESVFEAERPPHFPSVDNSTSRTDLAGKSPASSKSSTIQRIPSSSESPAEQIAALNDHIDKIDEYLTLRLQYITSDLRGKEPPQFEECVRIVELIQSTAQRLGRLFECPKCAKAASLRYVRSGKNKSAIFSFVHAKTTHSGGLLFPHLKLIDAAGASVIEEILEEPS